MATGLGEVSAVQAHPPTHNMVIGHLPGVHHLQSVPQVCEATFSKVGIGFLFCAPLRALPLDSIADVLRGPLITMIASGELVVLKRRTMASVRHLVHGGRP